MRLALRHYDLYRPTLNSHESSSIFNGMHPFSRRMLALCLIQNVHSFDAAAIHLGDRHEFDLYDLCSFLKKSVLFNKFNNASIHLDFSRDCLHPLLFMDLLCMDPRMEQREKEKT